MSMTYLCTRELDNKSIVHEICKLFHVSRSQGTIVILLNNCHVFLRDQVALDKDMTHIEEDNESIDIRAATRIESEELVQPFF